MGNLDRPWAYTPSIPSTFRTTDTPHWYAVQTKPRHEKKVAMTLQGEGMEVFLPLLRHLHHWSDRRKAVNLPLFPCYAFIRTVPCAELRLAVLRTSGVIKLVGSNGDATPIPDTEIADIRMLLANKVSLSPWPALKAGQRVRICGGCLDGLEGTLVRNNGESKLVISVELINKAVAISLNGYEVELI